MASAQSHESEAETKKPAVSGRAVNDRTSVDQSRHRSAAKRPRHQRRTVEAAAMVFSGFIGFPVERRVGGGQGT